MWQWIVLSVALSILGFFINNNSSDLFIGLWKFIYVFIKQLSCRLSLFFNCIYYCHIFVVVNISFLLLKPSFNVDWRSPRGAHKNKLGDKLTVEYRLMADNGGSSFSTVDQYLLQLNGLLRLWNMEGMSPKNCLSKSCYRLRPLINSPIDFQCFVFFGYNNIVKII